MKKFAVLIIVCMLLPYSKSISQDNSDDSNLLSMLDSIEPDDNITTYESGTFNSVRLINGYTCETAAKKELYFSISHRFNYVNLGFYDFFGLDYPANIRFGFEYGLGDRIDIGIGRGNSEKLYDGFVKFKIARQSSGKVNFPFTITLLEGVAVKTERISDTNSFSDRLYYVHELFIARKFGDNLSLQLSPVIIHRNFVANADDQKTVGAIGFGGKYRITKRISIVGEFYDILPGKTEDKFNNSFSIGTEIETGGGHIFQLHFSNSRGMTEKAFVPETTGKWRDGDIVFGFNIIRLFSFNKNKKI